MKLLFVTYENPFCFIAGDSVYSRDILRNLKHVSESVDVLTYATTQNKTIIDNINLYCNDIYYVPFKPKNKFRLVLSKYPSSIKNRKNKSFINAFRQLVENKMYDFVVINHFKLSFLIECFPKNSFRPKTVLISHNYEMMLAKSLYKYSSSCSMRIIYYLEYLKVKYYETIYLKQFDVLTAISDWDVEKLKISNPNCEVSLITPIVELNQFCNLNQESKNAIVCGSFTWEPKKENLLSLLNSPNFYKLSENGIRLYIVGNARDGFVNSINKRKGLEMTGFVQETGPFYKKSRVAIVPELLGGGFKLKIAEAVSHQIPIVALNVSITDSEMINGVHYIGADTFEELIDKAILVVNDLELSKMLVDNCTNLFEKKYSTKAMKERLSKILSL